MKASEKENKKSEVRGKLLVYYATRAHNDIYYQMASVFRAATRDEDALKKTLFDSFVTRRYPNFFMENQL